MKIRWLKSRRGVGTREAWLYYENERPGLGSDLIEVRKTILRIQQHPDSWPQVESGIRKSLTKRFPYLIHYTQREHTILIIGVYHAKRRPISWPERLK